MNNLSDFRVLFSKALEIAPRVIGHQDRNPLSPTYGIFGRRYWAWKNAAMPDASNQYAIYYLALLWSLDDSENRFFHQDELIKYIAAGIDAWCRLQHKDGSFDQMFPNEHSVGVTSYTALAVIETNKILGSYFSKNIKSKMAYALERAGKFLIKNKEEYGLISNHLALFAVTFNELWKITGINIYKEKCAEQIDLILKNTSKEGWFKEYESADPGYTTQCAYYLSRLVREGWDILKKPLGVAVKEYLPYFVHPDGSLGGCYGGRNTVLFYPAGFSQLFGEYAEAPKILKCMCQGITEGNSPSPASLDLPNASRLAVNYLLAWKDLKEKNSLINKNDYLLPWERSKIYKKFPEAGVVISGAPFYYCVIGLDKGGVLKIFDKTSRKLVFEDGGYSAELDNKQIATQVYSNSKIEYGDNSLRLIQPFFAINLRRVTPLKYLVILFLGMTAFRFKFFREKFKKILVNHLITGKHPVDCRLERQITFDDITIKIRNRIVALNNARLRNLRSSKNHVTIHMASANYFDFSFPGSCKEIVIPAVAKKGVTIDYLFTFRDGKFSETIR